LTTVAETPEGVMTPSMMHESDNEKIHECNHDKQRCVREELENWNIQELEVNQDDSECPDYDVHRCKAPFTDMAFDLRNSDVHKHCSHAHSTINILLMERIAIFRQKMPARCKKSMIDAFDRIINKF